MSAFQHMLYEVQLVTHDMTHAHTRTHIHTHTRAHTHTCKSGCSHGSQLCIIMYEDIYTGLASCVQWQVHPVRLFLSRPNLGGLHGNAKELSHAMAQATVLADSVSSKVRTLDLAKVTA